jgi:hypothetical protein
MGIFFLDQERKKKLQSNVNVCGDTQISRTNQKRSLAQVKRDPRTPQKKLKKKKKSRPPIHPQDIDSADELNGEMHKFGPEKNTQLVVFSSTNFTQENFPAADAAAA